MKNLHYLKKFAAIVVSAMMVLSTLALPTFAAGEKTITINGVEAGVEATAYKIADVNTNGTVARLKNANGDVIIGEDVIKNLEQPKSDEIIKLAAKLPATSGDLASLTKVGPVVATGDSLTLSNAAPGIYLVTFAIGKDAQGKAVANPDYIYNPVIVSVNKTGDATSFAINDDDPTTANVDESTKYTWGNTAQVKKSKVPFDKVVERTLDKIEGDDKGTNTPITNTENDGGENESIVNGGNRGDTANKGETVSFRINTTLPAYADNYFTAATSGNTGSTVATDPGFQVWDTLDGLTLKTGTVKLYDAVSGEALPAEYYTVTENPDIDEDGEADPGFKVVFTSAGVWNKRGKAIEVRYSATVNDNAERVNFNPDTNTAKCKYTRAPGEEPTDGEERTTYHYKFTINGRIQGNSGEYNREVIKVGTDEAGDLVFLETTDGKMTEKGWKPLDGVTFKLYKEDKTTKVVDNVVSADGGVLKNMDQLDAGVYYLKEDQTQAVFDKDTGTYKDDKYVPNSQWIKIEIKAKLLDDGRLDSYMVLVDDNCVGNYKATYTNDYELVEGTKVVDGAGTFYQVASTTDVGAGDSIVSHRHGITKPDGTVLTDGADNWNHDYDVAADIRNTHEGTLPATGGMGTVLFTVGGIAIMALALFLLFGGKKKEEQK